MTELVFASNNAHKLAEIKALCSAFSIKILSLSDIGFIEEIEETELTLEGNSRLKAERIHEFSGRNVFSDDTGLEVYQLGMEPGVFSSRYAGEPPDDENNIRKLLRNLEGETDRRARFRTVVTLIYEGEISQFDGIVEGYISEEAKGASGFGYDPIFIPEGFSISFAQMTAEEKNSTSHRKRALTKTIRFLEERIRSEEGSA